MLVFPTCKRYAKRDGGQRLSLRVCTTQVATHGRGFLPFSLCGSAGLSSPPFSPFTPISHHFGHSTLSALLQCNGKNSPEHQALDGANGNKKDACLSAETESTSRRGSLKSEALHGLSNQGKVWNGLGVKPPRVVWRRPDRCLTYTW